MERRIEFGNALKALRKTRKLTQTELAKIMGVSQNIISRYESGEIFPAFEVLTKFADYFNVSLDELVYQAEPAANSVIEQNQKFLEDVLNGMSLEELIMKYNIEIDGRRATLEEAKRAINAIRFDRFHNSIS